MTFFPIDTLSLIQAPIPTNVQSPISTRPAIFTPGLILQKLPITTSCPSVTPEFINEKIGDYTFKISPNSFFQTNSEQAKVLYRKTKELAAITENDLVYDLYTGTGTIAQYVAASAKKVVGIDSVEEGIKAAYENAERNNIENCTFHTGDIKELFTDEFIAENGTPDIIITDPPRDGMHKKVVEQILKIGAKRIVYVSCNSATQARDLSLMDELYKVTHIQPVDMFPQTHHVENIVVLEKREIMIMFGL